MSYRVIFFRSPSISAAHLFNLPFDRSFNALWQRVVAARLNHHQHPCLQLTLRLWSVFHQQLQFYSMCLGSIRLIQYQSALTQLSHARLLCILHRTSLWDELVERPLLSILFCKSAKNRYMSFFSPLRRQACLGHVLDLCHPRAIELVLLQAFLLRF